MSNRKHDYDAMERQYVRSTVSLRELARDHGVSHSLVMIQSKRRDWVRKREEFLAQASDKTVTYMAGTEAVRRAREAQIRDNALDAIDEAITKLRDDMKRTHVVERHGERYEEPVMTFRPTDVAILLDRLQVLLGKPSQITEDRSLELKFDGVTPDLLKQFVDATRGIGPLDVASSPIPRTDRTREN